MPGYPSGQRGQTVNLLAYAFRGSNPLPGTFLVEKWKSMITNFENRPFFSRNGRNNQSGWTEIGNAEDWREIYPVVSCILNHSRILEVNRVAREHGLPFDYIQFLHAMQNERFSPFEVECNGQRFKFSRMTDVIKVVEKIDKIMHPTRWG